MCNNFDINTLKFYIIIINFDNPSISLMKVSACTLIIAICLTAYSKTLTKSPVHRLLAMPVPEQALSQSQTNTKSYAWSTICGPNFIARHISTSKPQATWHPPAGGSAEVYFVIKSSASSFAAMKAFKEGNKKEEVLTLSGFSWANNAWQPAAEKKVTLNKDSTSGEIVHMKSAVRP